MNTLITAATSAEAHRLKKQLEPAEIILGDYEDIPAFMLGAGMIKLPNPQSPAYAHEMLTLCLDKQINLVYPLRGPELNILRQAKQLFSEYGIKIVSHPPMKTSR